MRIRVTHYLAQCGVQSRRASEQLIAEGRVAVNGRRIAHTQLIDADHDTVTVNDRAVTPAPKIYYAFHKPVDVICSSVRQGPYPIVWDFIHVYKKMHLFTVGRLDRLTSGLLLITNDGAFANHLALPSHGVEREYIVQTHHPIPLDAIREFLPSRAPHASPSRHPYTIRRYVAVSKKCIRIVVTEGRNHEIRNIMRYCRCGVVSLTRVRIDTISLSALKVGGHRELTKQEREHAYRAPQRGRTQ